jgi:hypothetical protein
MEYYTTKRKKKLQPHQYASLKHNIEERKPDNREYPV